MVGWRGGRSWKDRIRDAREAGAFTKEDFDLAMRWSTCAVGESMAGNSGAFWMYLADDGALVSLGHQFTVAVGRGSNVKHHTREDRLKDIALAEELLGDIETEILRLYGYGDGGEGGEGEGLARA